MTMITSTFRKLGGATITIKMTTLVMTAAMLCTGCAESYRVDTQTMSLAASGEYGAARESVAWSMSQDPRDRAFMLDRMKFVLMSLAEGLPEGSELAVDDLYDRLREQGVNDGTEFATGMVGEGAARFWKGEPFEQAMAYHYVGLYDAMDGGWGNTRACAENALFLLRDFSHLYDEDADQLEQRRAVLEADFDPDEDDTTDVSTDDGFAFTPEDSDFELGWVMRAIAARQTGMREDLKDALGSLRRVAPHLSSLADQIESGTYNTVLVVDAGFSPEKIAMGPNGVFSGYQPRSSSGQGPLEVVVNGRSTRHPVVTDLNRLALDLKWNNLEDLRVARSAVGEGLTFGGSVVAASSDDRDTQIIGLIVAGLGMAMQSNARVDTRHCELMPQRSYVVLLDLPSNPVPIEIRLAEGRQGGDALMIGAHSAPEWPNELGLMYVRLPLDPLDARERVVYSNDATGVAPGEQLPYILGGHCVRRPTWDVLRSYQDSGSLRDFTLDDLIDLYRMEGITIPGTALENGEWKPGRHVLEGGDVMYTPRAGSAGAVRLFHQRHGRYQPRSDEVRKLMRATIRKTGRRDEILRDGTRAISEE